MDPESRANFLLIPESRSLFTSFPESPTLGKCFLNVGMYPSSHRFYLLMVTIVVN